MKPVEFPEQTTVFAKDQPQYLPLPACRVSGNSGLVVFCWKLNWRERLKLFLVGQLWHGVLTFDQPLQPQKLSVNKTELL